MRSGPDRFTADRQLSVRQAVATVRNKAAPLGHGPINGIHKAAVA